MSRLRFVLSTILLVWLGISCTSLPGTILPGTPLPSPFPTNTIPTINVQASSTPAFTNIPSIVPADTQPASSTPTPEATTPIVGPSQTVPAFNRSPTSSPSPSATSTPDLSATATPRPSRTPTITRTPPIPNAGVQISEPGPMSRVTSPLNLIANMHTIPSGSYHVEIWIEPLQPGGEARLLFREVKRIVSSPRDWINLDYAIEFELSRVSEFGQLRLSVFDQFDRPVSVNSLDLILLSMGVSDITPTGWLSEPIIIREPTPNHLIQGGTVIVSGMVKPTEKSMLIELTAADGTVAGYSEVFVIPSPDGSYVPFSAEVPYQVTKSTWVRLSISESNPRIPGIERLSSVEVYLSP